MKVHKDVIQEIEEGAEGPQIGAFFDFDGTLIAGFSATVFLKEQLRRGDISPYQFVDAGSALAQFSLGTHGFFRADDFCRAVHARRQEVGLHRVWPGTLRAADRAQGLSRIEGDGAGAHGRGHTVA